MTRHISSVDLQGESTNSARDVHGDDESDEPDTPVESEGSDDAGLVLVADDVKAPLGLFDEEVSDDSVGMYMHEIVQVCRPSAIMGHK